MNFHFNINTKACVVLANKLEKFRKSALPNAVRNTLNSAAFDVKQKSMPVSSKKHFVNRKENFFKANSKVVMAQGYNIKAMRSTVGFVHTNAKYNNYAVDELEQQEFSGSIPKRSLVPFDQARSGGEHSGQILPTNRLHQLKIIDAAKIPGRSKKQQFIIAALIAKNKWPMTVAGAGKTAVQGTFDGKNGSRTVFRINSVKRKKGGKWEIDKTRLYSVKTGRSVRINKATHFMREASYISAGKMNMMFRKEAMRQFQRTYK
jgi:hypothetical protein